MTRIRQLVAIPAIGTFVALACWSVVLRTAGAASTDLTTAVGQALFTIALPLFAGVGAVIVLRRPGHRLGWLLVAAGVMGTLDEALRAFVETQPRFPVEGFGPWAALVSEALSGPQFVVLTVLLPLLFPDGQLPSPRWRPVLWSVGAAAIASVVAILVAPGPIEWFIDDGHVAVATNPLGVEAFGATIPEAVENVAATVLAVGMVAAIVALVKRARGDRVHRAQIKWVALAMALVILTTLSTAIPGLETIGSTLSSVALLFVPISVGIAVTRYRLYEIDRVISRTLSYAAPTGALVGVYAIGVLGVGALLLGEPTDLLVAGSTLAVAALFRPLRSRIQGMVDRRFNRARFDAAHTVKEFGARLRDEVDLASLSSELRDVAEVTMQPRIAGVWVRGATR